MFWTLEIPFKTGFTVLIIVLTPWIRFSIKKLTVVYCQRDLSMETEGPIQRSQNPTNGHHLELSASSIPSKCISVPSLATLILYFFLWQDLPSGLPPSDWNSVCTAYHFHACYVLNLSHPPWFYYSDANWRRVNIVEAFIIQFSIPLFFHVLWLGFKYTSGFVPENCHSMLLS
jgi:hypothetical protein